MINKFCYFYGSIGYSLLRNKEVDVIVDFFGFVMEYFIKRLIEVKYENKWNFLCFYLVSLIIDWLDGGIGVGLWFEFIINIKMWIVYIVFWMLF